jgi:ketosteroid isomerase-like protein
MDEATGAAHREAINVANNQVENIELVRRGIAAFLGGDRDTALATASPDVIAVRTAPLPDAQIYHGHEGIERMWADWTAEFDRFEMATRCFAEIGGRVLVEVIQRGAGKNSGVEVEGRFWFVYTIADQLIARMDVFASESQALEAVG